MQLKEEENKIEIIRLNNDSITNYKSMNEKINKLFKELKEYNITGNYKLENHTLQFLFVKIGEEKVTNVRAVYSEKEFKNLILNDVIIEILKFFN